MALDCQSSGISEISLGDFWLKKPLSAVSTDSTQKEAIYTALKLSEM